MKPEFALSLAPEGVSLLHRVNRGWQMIGETTLYGPGLKRRLAELRQAALDIAPGGVACKLMLPESQILYTTIACSARDAAGRVAAIEAVLEGATPYALDEIRYDWEAEGDALHLAVVARETLDEAEAFAVEHGFNPVSVVAGTGGGSFTGEPFFGATRHAESWLAPGASVERDALPTFVTLRLNAPVSVAAAAPVAVPTAALPAAEPDAPPLEAPLAAPEPAGNATLDETPAPTRADADEATGGGATYGGPDADDGARGTPDAADRAPVAAAADPAALPSGVASPSASAPDADSALGNTPDVDADTALAAALAAPIPAGAPPPPVLPVFSSKRNRDAAEAAAGQARIAEPRVAPPAALQAGTDTPATEPDLPRQQIEADPVALVAPVEPPTGFGDQAETRSVRPDGVGALDALPAEAEAEWQDEAPFIAVDDDAEIASEGTTPTAAPLAPLAPLGDPSPEASLAAAPEEPAAPEATESEHAAAGPADAPPPFAFQDTDAEAALDTALLEALEGPSALTEPSPFAETAAEADPSAADASLSDEAAAPDAATEADPPFEPDAQDEAAEVATAGTAPNLPDHTRPTAAEADMAEPTEPGFADEDLPLGLSDGDDVADTQAAARIEADDGTAPSDMATGVAAEPAAAEPVSAGPADASLPGPRESGDAADNAGIQGVAQADAWDAAADPEPSEGATAEAGLTDEASATDVPEDVAESEDAGTESPDSASAGLALAHARLSEAAVVPHSEADTNVPLSAAEAPADPQPPASSEDERHGGSTAAVAPDLAGSEAETAQEEASFEEASFEEASSDAPSKAPSEPSGDAARSPASSPPAAQIPSPDAVAETLRRAAVTAPVLPMLGPPAPRVGAAAPVPRPAGLRAKGSASRAPAALRKVLARQQRAAAADPRAAGEAGTAASARRGRRRTPVLGFVLTAGLVAFMAAMVLWSLFFVSEPGSGDVATLPAPTPVTAAPTVTAAAPDLSPLTPNAGADADLAAAAPTLPMPPQSPAADATPPVPQPAEPPVAAEAADTAPGAPLPQDPAVAYAATGIWQESPEAPSQTAAGAAPQTPEARDGAPVASVTAVLPEAAAEAPVAPPQAPVVAVTADPATSPEADQVAAAPAEATGTAVPVVRLERPPLTPPARSFAAAGAAAPEAAPAEAGLPEQAQTAAVAPGVPAAAADAAGAVAPPPAAEPTAEPAEVMAALPSTSPVLPFADPSLAGVRPRARTAAAAPVAIPEATSDVPAAAAASDAGPAEVAAITAAPADAVVPDAPLADPALAGFRPRARPAPPAEPSDGADAALPDAAAPEAASPLPPVAEAAPDAADAPVPQAATAAPLPPPVADPALAGFRPRGRPAALEVRAAAEITAQAQSDSVGASLDAAQPSGAAASSPQSFAGASDYAVAVALVPRSRPSGFAEQAQRRREAAAAQAAAAQAAEQVAAQVAAQAAAQAAAAVAAAPPAQAAIDPEAEADGEMVPMAAQPAPATSAGPQIPTRASVAAQATVPNAIRLGQVNLIGIYGSASDRRALIRLPSGRYVKVQVGDRVDGGQVAAISERELVYVKNGRNNVLRVAGR